MFLNPILLTMAALGAVPIIIHLLNKSRFRPVVWAAMEFLLTAVQQNSRRLQLRDIILMLIRAAAVIFLAVALARPTVNYRTPIGGTKTGAIILLDNSLSMGYNNGRETRFDVAKRLAKSVIAQLEPGSWCALYTFNTEPGQPLGRPSNRLDFVEREIEKAVLLSDGETNIERAIAAVKRTFTEDASNFQEGSREVYIITDMQDRPWNKRWNSDKFGEALKELGGGAAVYLINAGDTGSENAAITDLKPTDTLATVDMPISFTATIRNFGQSPITSMPIDFYLDPVGTDDKPVQRSTVDVEPRGTATVTFETKFVKGGDHRVEVRLAEDRLVADGRRYCSIEVIDETHVLLVDGKDQQNDDPLSNETGFLRFALSPIDPENPEKQSVITTQSVPYYRIGDKNLLSFQTVVLANVPKLQQQTVQLLERQVRSGMGLMVFLGDQVDAAAYNSMLGAGAANLLPAKIGEAVGDLPTIDAATMPPSQSFLFDKLSHPIMSDFNAMDVGKEFLDAVKLYRSYELTPATEDSVEVVAYFSNGKPAIVERRVGAGYVLLFAFPSTAAWSNIPTQPVFTIMMLRAAHRLTLGNRMPKNLMVSSQIHYQVALSDKDVMVRMQPPGLVPKIEKKAEMKDNKEAYFTFANTERAGFYDVTLDRTPPVRMAFAVNSNSEIESNLESINPEQIRRDYPGFDFSYVATTDDLSAKLQSERRGSELWPWLIAMVFLLLATESILANRWSPKE